MRLTKVRLANLLGLSVLVVTFALTAPANAQETNRAPHGNSVQPEDKANDGAPLFAPSKLLRESDLERSIWFIDDLATYFEQIANGSNNKHARAAWLILEENYRSAAQVLNRLWRDQRLVITDLPEGNEAAIQDETLLVDEDLDGAWSRERFAADRQIGGDDWNIISHLSSILIPQFAALRTLEDWPWYKRLARQSAVLPQEPGALEPFMVAALVRFGFLRDKYLLAVIRARSATNQEVAELWRRRSELIAAEVNVFLERHADLYGQSSAEPFSRAWPDYAESANQASESYQSIVFTTPPPSRLGINGATTSVEADSSRTVLWPPIETLIAQVPERLKSHVEARSDAAGAGSGRTEEELQATRDSPTSSPLAGGGDAQQTAAWRDELSRQSFQPNGITVRIRDETGRPEAIRTTSDHLFSESGDGSGDPRNGQDPIETAAGADPVASTSSPQRGPTGPQVAGDAGSLLAWLEDAVRQHRELVAFLPVVTLLILILVIIAWMWRSLNTRSEEPLILTAVVDEDFDASGERHFDQDDPALTIPAASHLSQVPHRPAPSEQPEHTVPGQHETAPLDDVKTAAKPSLMTAIAKAKTKRRAVEMPKTTDENDSQDVGPNALVSALRSGNRRQFESLLQQLSGLSRRDVRDMLQQVKGEEVAVVGRAIGLDRLVFASLLIMARRQYLEESEVPPHQISNALAAFNSISQEEAIKRVRSWAIDTDFSSADDVRDPGSAAGFGR